MLEVGIVNRVILIVDDEPNIRKILSTLLAKEGRVITASNAKEAIEVLKHDKISIVITDQKMPDMDGLTLLRYITEKYPYIPVIIITAYGTVDRAVEAIKMGAYDYITKPFDQEELLTIVRKALQSSYYNWLEPFNDEFMSSTVIGTSSVMQHIFNTINKVADTPSTVLITGESGTGKELVARSIHRLSSRRDKPFVKINCTAIPKELIESELFGYEKGAFTGALNSKPGRFELADEGTIFLDEIGDIDTSVQVKLLRVLQDGEFERIGGLKTIKVNVRVICATNRDLKEALKRGLFREDLYYRLNVVNIHIPPLRERKEDIPQLVSYFINKFNRKLNKNITGITDKAMEYLISYQWPGNVRELENVIERAILFADSIITAKELPQEIKESVSMLPEGISPTVIDLKELPGDDFKEKVKLVTYKIEKELIEKALRCSKGNISQAARLLKLSRKGLQLKIKELNIDINRIREEFIGEK